MIYHHLHGSVERFYRDVRVDPPIPKDWDKAVPEQVKNLLRYGAKNELHHHSMLCLSRNGESRLLRVCCAECRMSDTTANFFHKQLMDITPQELLEKFDELLEISFMTEEQMNRIAKGEVPGQPGYRWSGPREYLDIPEQVLKAVLYGMVDRWRFGSNAVLIEVPGDVDYDSYTYQAVRTIYACLPAALRGIAGFMTYTEPNNDSTAVTLFFVPESARHERAIRLDRVTDRHEYFLKCGLPIEVKDMLDRIVSLFKAGKWVEHAAYLRQIMEDLENTMPLNALRCLHYASYLRERKLLDVPVETEEGFRQWCSFADTYQEEDKSPLKVRLCEALKARMTEEVLREHVFDKAAQADCLAAFKEKVHIIDGVCELCPEAQELVKKEAEAYFAQRLAQVKECVHAQTLLAQISGAEDELGSYPEQEMLENFKKRSKARWKELSDNKVEELKNTALNRLEEIFRTDNDLGYLIAQGTKCKSELTKSAKSEELWLSQEEINSAGALIHDKLCQKLRARAQVQVQLSSDLPELLTAEAKGKETNRLLELRKFLTNMKEDDLKRKLDVPGLLKILSDSEKKLKNRYAKTTEYRKEKLESAVDVPNHFEKFQNLGNTAKHLGNISEEEQSQALKKIQDERPATFRAYREDFERCYGSKMSFRKIGTLAPQVFREINDALAVYENVDCAEIPVDNSDLFLLVNRLNEEIVICRSMLGREPEKIRLSYNTVDDGGASINVSFEEDKYVLNCVLEALVGGFRIPGVALLGEFRLNELLDFLDKARVLADRQIPGILDVLFEAGMDQVACVLLERRLVDSGPGMEREQWLQVALCCKNHGKGKMLREIIPAEKDYQQLREEVEQICGENKQKKKGKLNLRGIVAVSALLISGAVGLFIGKDSVKSVELAQVQILAESEAGETLDGTSFAVLDVNNRKVAQFTTADDADTLFKLELGAYTIHNMAVPDGFVLAQDMAIHVTDESNNVFTVVIPEEAAPAAAIEIITRDENEMALSGVRFEIVDADGRVVKELMIDSVNGVEVSGLPLGSYTIRCVEVPNDYKIPEDIPVTLTDAGGKQSFVVTVVAAPRIRNDDGTINWNLVQEHLSDIQSVELSNDTMSKRLPQKLLASKEWVPEAMLLTKEWEEKKVPYVLLLRRVSVDKSGAENQEVAQKLLDKGCAVLAQGEYCLLVSAYNAEYRSTWNKSLKVSLELMDLLRSKGVQLTTFSYMQEDGRVVDLHKLMTDAELSGNWWTYLDRLSFKDTEKTEIGQEIQLNSKRTISVAIYMEDGTRGIVIDYANNESKGDDQVSASKEAGRSSAHVDDFVIVMLNNTEHIN